MYVRIGEKRTEKLDERRARVETKGVSRRRKSKSVGGQRGFRVAVADSDGSGGGGSSGVVVGAASGE